MIIHKYIQRITKDKGLIDNSETDMCCEPLQEDFWRGEYKVTYEAVIHNETNKTMDKCPHCKMPVFWKKHYVSLETLYKHMSKQFVDKAFI